MEKEYRMNRKPHIVICGIYKIQSKLFPSKFYIGSSLDIYSRWSKHKNDFKFNRSHHTAIQNHVNKYGLDDLELFILEKCKYSNLGEKEQNYIINQNPPFNLHLLAGRIDRNFLPVPKNLKIAVFQMQRRILLLNELAPEIIIPLNI